MIAGSRCPACQSQDTEMLYQKGVTEHLNCMPCGHDWELEVATMELSNDCPYENYNQYGEETW